MVSPPAGAHPAAGAAGSVRALAPAAGIPSLHNVQAQSMTEHTLRLIMFLLRLLLCELCIIV